MNGFRLTLALLALGAPAVRSAAQDRPVVAIGDTVRLFGAARQPLQGVLRSVDSTSITVEPLDTGTRASMPRALIIRIETLRGHPRRGIRPVLEGAMIGGIVGGLAGSVVARVQGNHGELAGVAIIGGGAVGAIVGTSVGLHAAFTRSDRWIPVGLRTLSLLETP
jgi:hypothetical protein